MQLPGSVRNIIVCYGNRGRESESMSSKNAGMAAAVLSPGGVFMDKNKKKIRKSILTASTFPLPTPIRVPATSDCLETYFSGGFILFSNYRVCVDFSGSFYFFLICVPFLGS